MSFALIFNLIGRQVKYAVWVDWNCIRGGFASRAAAHEYAKGRFSRYKVKVQSDG